MSRGMWVKSRTGCVVLVMGHMLVGCSNDGGSSSSDGSGGSGLGTGGGEPGSGGNQQGTGGTEQGTGGAEPGTGGSPGSGGSNPGSGGTAAGTGGSGGEGGAGEAGAPAEGGAAGAPACASQCDPCDGDFELSECEDRCICELPGNSYKDLHEKLLSCELDEPCPDSTLEQNPIIGTGWQNGECLLAGLRDRGAGSYRFSAMFSDLGTSATNYVLLVDGTDEVIVLTTTESSLAVGNVIRDHWPVERCTLKSYEELEACLSAGTEVSTSTTGGGSEGVCAAPETWLDDCEVVDDAECP